METSGERDYYVSSVWRFSGKKGYEGEKGVCPPFNCKRKIECWGNCRRYGFADWSSEGFGGFVVSINYVRVSIVAFAWFFEVENDEKF